MENENIPTVDNTSITIEEIRKRVSPFQRNLLQEAWKRYRVKGEWPTLRELYRDQGKEKVKTALAELGGCVCYEETGSHKWSRCALSLLGTLLTEDGPKLQGLMTRFFEFQRHLFQTDPTAESAKSTQIKQFLRLSHEDCSLLGLLVFLGGLGGGNVNTEWSVNAMEHAVDFQDSDDASMVLDQWICKGFDPKRPVFQDQRIAQFQQHTANRLDIEDNPMVHYSSDIAVSIQRLRQKYPDAKRLGFLMMRISAAKPFENIVRSIKQTAKLHGLDIIRADEHEFHSDLWGNVRTFLHGCSFGVAVYERIESEEPNANVGLEVGYLMAMNKPVLLLKDKTVKEMQSDLTGRLYKPFDPHDPDASIPHHMRKWFEDNGITLSQKP